MNLRAKARRPLGVLAFVAAIGFLFASVSPAGAQESTDNGNHEMKYRASVHGSCEQWAVTIENNSHHDVDASITLNGVETIVEVEEESHLTVPLDVLEDVPNTIVVAVGEQILLSKSFSVNCEPDPKAELSATIGSDCANFTVTIKNDGDADGSATVSVNGSTVDVDVPAGETVTMTAVVTEDADNTITVMAGDTQLAHKTFHVDCKKDELPTTTTTTRPPAPTTTEPPVEVLSETVVAQPETLAFTGRSTVFEVMIGVVLLGIGMQLIRSSRRLEQS